MGRELYLHIGTTKTGSTAIQNTLSQRRRDLQQLGIYVQNRPAKASHSLLAASVLDNLAVAPGRGHPMWGGIAPKTRLERFRKEFSVEMDSLPAWVKGCIISSEHLSNWLQNGEEVSRLAEWLKPYFQRVTVIVYLRRQDQHVSSGYNEVLKSGIIPTTDLTQSADIIATLDYQTLTARYASAFGPSSIRPRIFARDDLLNKNVVDDFLHTIGVELSPTEQPASNQSLNLVGQDLLTQAIRRLGSRNPAAKLNTLPEWRVLTHAVEAQCRGPGWKLSASAAQAFMSLFERSNEHVRSHYFPERSELFGSSYTEKDGEPPTPDAKFDSCLDVIFGLAQMHCEREAQFAMAQYRLFLRLEDQTGMRDMLRQALRYAPDNIVTRLRLAELMMADGRMAETLDHLEAVLRLDPQNKEAKRKKMLWSRQKREAAQSAGKPADRPARQPPP